MKNGKKKIQLLRGLIIFISILILIVVLMIIRSIYTNTAVSNVKTNKGTGTTKPTDDLVIETSTPIGDIEPEEPMTEETTVPSTSTTTTKKTTVKKTTSVRPTSVIITTTTTAPSFSYTVITSGYSGYKNSKYEFEWQMVDYINSERTAKGLAPLKVASELRWIAEDYANMYQSSDDIPAEYITFLYKSTAKYINGVTDKIDGIKIAYNMTKNYDALISDPRFEYVGIGVIEHADNYTASIIIG